MNNELENNSYVIKVDGGVIEITDEGITMIRNTKEGGE